MGLRIVTETHTIDVPQAIEAEGGVAVERYVAEELARRTAIADVTAPDSSPNPPTLAEGAES